MQPLSCIILAGGLSSRMGRDKAFLPICQQHDLLTHMVNLARSAGAANILVSRSPALQPEALGYIPFIADYYPQQGPLAGLQACLPNCNYERILVLPVDMPALNNEVLQMLLNSTTSACYKGYELPLLIVADSGQRDQLQRFLNEQLQSANARRSIRSMLHFLQVNELPVMHKQHMLNTNSPEQWQLFLSLKDELQPDAAKGNNQH